MEANAVMAEDAGRRCPVCGSRPRADTVREALAMLGQIAQLTREYAELIRERDALRQIVDDVRDTVGDPPPDHRPTDTAQAGTGALDAAIEAEGGRAVMSYPQTLGDLAREINTWTHGQGFYDPDRARGFDGHLALVHSEVSEALEHWRDGREIDEIFHVDGKPDGVPIELADVLIRVLDIMAEYGIDPDHAVWLKMTYNRTRPHRNGGKRS